MSLARSIVCAAAVFVLVAFALTEAIGQDYPSRAVTIVNPFAPGGGTDLLARMVAQKLDRRRLERRGWSMRQRHPDRQKQWLARAPGTRKR